MKRLCFILSLILMLSTSLPILPVCAAGDEFLIMAPNFNGSDASVKRNSALGQWTIVTPPYSTTWLNGFTDGILYRNAAAPGSTPASMQIYVPSDNTYRIYVRIKDFKEISPRMVYMKIDGGPIMVFGSRPDLTSAPDGIEANKNPLPEGMSIDTFPTVSQGGIWYWDGAESHHTPVTLTKGFHTITINNPTSGSPRVDAIVFKTEGDTFSKPSSFDAYLQGLKDVTAPVFSGEINLGQVGDNSIAFSWSAADDKGIAVYEIYRNDTLIKTLDRSASSYTDNGLAEGNTYNYTLKAIDRLGQYSEKTASFATTGTPDTEPPTWPANAAITVNSIGTSSADISWTAAVDNKSIGGYSIYKNSVSPENLLMTVSGNVTSASVANLPSGTTTKILIKAKDLALYETATTIEADVTTRSEVKYLLRAENFTLPTPAGGWAKDPLTSTNGANSIPGDILRNSYADGEKPAEASVYLPDNDKYYIWALGRDFSSSAPGTRWFSIGIDDTFDPYKFAAKGIDGWSWEKGFSKDLSAGWHKIGVKPGGGYARVSAILITNDSSLVLDNTTSANYTTKLAPLEDKTAPVMDTVRAVCNTDDSMDISWNAASDAGKGVKGYKVYVNNSAQAAAALGQNVTSYKLAGLNATDSVNIKVEALDAYGNKGSASINKKVSVFETSKFIIADSAGVQANNLSALTAGGKAAAVVSLSNQSASSKPILLGIAVYEKTTGRMVASDRKATNVAAGALLTDFKAEVALPAGFASSPSSYYVYAAIWDNSDNMAPQEAGKLLEN